MLTRQSPANNESAMCGTQMVSESTRKCTYSNVYSYMYRSIYNAPTGVKKAQDDAVDNSSTSTIPLPSTTGLPNYLYNFNVDYSSSKSTLRPAKKMNSATNYSTSKMKRNNLQLLYAIFSFQLSNILHG